MTEFFFTTFFPVLMIIAGASDVLTLRIPNKLTLFIAFSAFPAAFILGMPNDALAMHAAAGAAMLVLGFGLFSFGLIGGGDAKLMAAAGVWFGWTGLMTFFTMTALAGGVLALTLIVWSNVRMHAEVVAAPVLGKFGIVKPPIPYGFAFAIGAIVAYPESWWMTDSVLRLVK